jgi:ethanolamine ammonia-lyase large subunit
MPKAALLPIALGVAGTAMAGAGMYSASKEASAAKKAANAQKEIAMANIAAAKESETVAAQTAKDKLKLRQASRSQTILTDPDLEETNISGKKVLGV